MITQVSCKSQSAIPIPNQLLLLAKLDEIGRPLLPRLDLRIVPQLARFFGHDFTAAEKETDESNLRCFEEVCKVLQNRGRYGI